MLRLRVASLVLTLAALFAACILIGAPTTGATGEEPDIVYIIEDQVYKGQEGTTVEIGTFQVPDYMAGRSCNVTIIGDNTQRPSPHPDNDLVMETGNQMLEVNDFEREEYQVTTVTELLQLGGELKVYLRFGPDEKSSGGVMIELDDCVYLAYLPVVNGPSLPRGDVSLNSTVYCSPESGYVHGFAWTKNSSDTYYVDVSASFMGWEIGSGRLMPGEEKTMELVTNLTSIQAGTVVVTLKWENGDEQTLERPFEAIDCEPADWVVVHVERDPWVWSTHINWESIPMWFQPPQEELRLVKMPVGRQIALQAHGHTVEYVVVEWFDEEYILAVYVDGIEVETLTGEVAEIVLRDENGIVMLAIFITEGCGTNECQNVTAWWRADAAATGMLVDIANEW